MGDANLFLGLDTSNYTTSVAIINEEDEIVEDKRELLFVKDGEKGLRQSEALFQHWRHLPNLLDELLLKYAGKFKGVCVSDRPRPFKDSYMPVFSAGVASARIVAASLSVPLFFTTHQEGHFKAALYGNEINQRESLLAAHLSGGTLEFVIIKNRQFDLVGGTQDISYGQLLDRTGVLLGLPFPSGAALDKLAIDYNQTGEKNPLKPIFRKKTAINLSGIETQVQKMTNHYSKQEIAVFLFDRIAENFIETTEAAKEEYGVAQVLVTGGVAASRFLRERCDGLNYIFAQPKLCSDNAVGVALMKGKPFCL